MEIVHGFAEDAGPDQKLIQKQERLDQKQHIQQQQQQKSLSVPEEVKQEQKVEPT